MSKVTKKMRKLERRNAAVEFSKKTGSHQTAGTHLYHGKPPKYAKQVNDLGMFIGHIKVEKGVPFVRDTYE